MTGNNTLTLSLNAFIKLSAMDMSKQMAEISRRMQSDVGGYDFYRTLNQAIKAFIQNKTNDEVDYILSKASSPSEENYNRLAFEAFKKRFGSKKKKLSTFDKKNNLMLANKSVGVLVAPAFMLETSNEVEVYHIWATQNPTLNRYMGGMGCYICQEAFRKTSAANYKFKFFDAVSRRVYTKFQNNTPALVEKTAADIIYWANQ